MSLKGELIVEIDNLPNTPKRKDRLLLKSVNGSYVSISSLPIWIKSYRDRNAVIS